MKRIVQRALLVAMMGAGLASCGGNGGDAATTPPVVVPPAPAPQENQFGTAFATDFRASPTSAPATPADGDIIPLSLTTNPVNVG